ncbi:unnamed protein product [Rhizoctonia solani]|uniref:Zn(2)-C6 fungal-type domain-containing protein n=1 Tax=Rhizoctonia solani TaxID=456999 RepID=A0A8H2XTX9_9AGAM|nr:unnamed protein product [Rhizoctonia solani]
MITMERKKRPGPKATSCLTCKRRHKKCDKRLPVCERCRNGGLKCLGYDYSSDNRISVFPVESAKDNNSRSEHLEVGPQRERSEGPVSPGGPIEGVVTTTSASELLNLPGEFPNVEMGPQYLQGSLGKTAITGCAHPPAQTHTMFRALNGFSIRPFPLHQAARRQTQGDQDALLCNTQPTFQLMDRPMSTLRKLAGLYTEFPYSADPLRDLLGNRNLDEYILTQYDKLMGQWYFKTVDNHKRFQQWLFLRLQSSLTSFVRWIALINLGIFEAVLTGDASQRRFHNVWIGHIQNFLKRELSCSSTSSEIRDRRHDWLYVSLLKVMVDQTSYVYRTVRDVTPVFLELVFSNPILWPNHSEFTQVSLLNVLSSGSHELAYFVLMDCTCAMAFGLPQHVEYDTTVYSRISSPSHQWAHGTPTEFHAALADINACRDNTSTGRDWREIEHSLLTWQSQPGEYTFTESWMTIAWYAVQESWRLALLIYLYMAVCDVSSDDPRIQLYVKQLLQVVGTLKKQEASGAEISFLLQYLMAGICARNEAHRKVVRDVLAETREPKFWFLRGSDFVPVLDHLWHGAAVDGRPVKWCDYTRSREAMLPVVV